MKIGAQQSQLTQQLNLPMLSVFTSVVPEEKRAELVLALVELLVAAAQQPVVKGNDGGANECEAHR